MRRGHVANAKTLVKELREVGFVLTQGRHPKLRHPVTGAAITLPRSGGTNANCDGIFATKVAKLVKLYKEGT